MKDRPAALFVFAHQDDEIAMASRIILEIAERRIVLCIYLTDGRGTGVPTSVRNKESAAVLRSLGVEAAGIFFAGSDGEIPDGLLVENLETALQRLERWTERAEIGTVYSLAWEGGHQDHDASHLVAAAFARRRGILDRCFELPLYRGVPGHSRFFRVLAPMPGGPVWQERRISFLDGWRHSMLCWHYRSQRFSFLGLFPELFLKLAILRRERWRGAEVSRLMNRPHEGPLLYERRFRFPYERFMRAASDFLERHLASSATSARPEGPR